MLAKLELYKVFKEVTEAGSISAAAKNLYISQSAVSQSMRQLEQQLGSRLFVRGSRGIALTHEGRILYDYVKNAIGLLENGERRLAQVGELENGELAIGASDTLTSRYLLPFLQQFHKEHPGVSLKLMNGTSGKVLELLRSGQADIAFASAPVSDGDFRIETCFDTHLIFVAAPDYNCNFDHEYSLREIAAFPLILLERRASSRSYLEHYFLQNRLSLRPEIELGTHDLLIDLAAIGLGVACVTEEFVMQALERGTVKKLKTDFTIVPRHVAMCTLDAVEPTMAAKAFMELIRKGS